MHCIAREGAGSRGGGARRPRRTAAFRRTSGVFRRRSGSLRARRGPLRQLYQEGGFAGVIPSQSARFARIVGW